MFLLTVRGVIDTFPALISDPPNLVFKKETAFSFGILSAMECQP